MIIMDLQKEIYIVGVKAVIAQPSVNKFLSYMYLFNDAKNVRVLNAEGKQVHFSPDMDEFENKSVGVLTTGDGRKEFVDPLQVQGRSNRFSTLNITSDGILEPDGPTGPRFYALDPITEGWVFEAFAYDQRDLGQSPFCFHFFDKNKKQLSYGYNQDVDKKYMFSYNNPTEIPFGAAGPDGIFSRNIITLKKITGEDKSFYSGITE